MGFATDTNFSGLAGALAPLNGTATKVAPPDLLQGFKPGEAVDAQHINWILFRAISVAGFPVFGLGGDGDLIVGNTDVYLPKDTEIATLSWSASATGKIFTNGFKLSCLVLQTANMPAGAINCDGTNSLSSADYTQPGTYAFTVPSGVSSLTCDMWGAAGGLNTYGNVEAARAKGGRVQCTIPVTAGEVLTLRVGGKGADAYGSAYLTLPGGGYSAIYRGSTPLVIAGAGGGMGGGNNAGGGNHQGGAGGGTTGGTGQGGAAGGIGGGSGAGGAAGSGGTGATAGTALQGGRGANGSGASTQVTPAGLFGGGLGGFYTYSGGPPGGGGGGGGYYGGGGGGIDGSGSDGSGGGGGSSFTDGTVTGVTHTQGYSAASANGRIQFTGLAIAPGPNGISGTQGYGQAGVSPGGTAVNALIATGGRGGYAGGQSTASGSGAIAAAGTRDVSPLGRIQQLALCGMAGMTGPAVTGQTSSPSGGGYLTLRAAVIVRSASAAAGCIRSRGGAGVQPTGSFVTGGNGPGGAGGGVVDVIYGELQGTEIANALDASGGNGAQGGTGSGSQEGAGGGEGGEGGKIYFTNLFTGVTRYTYGLPGAPGIQIANGGGTTGGLGGLGGACVANL